MTPGFSEPALRAATWLSWLVLLVGCRSDVVLVTLDGSTADAGVLPSRLGRRSTVPWRGGDHYLHGANLPWHRFGRDFGTDEGVSSEVASDALRSTLEAARGDGFRVVRWFVFPDSDVGIERDASGRASGLSSALEADLMAARDLAQAQGVWLWVELFSASSLPLEDVVDPVRRAAIAEVAADIAERLAGATVVFSPHADVSRIGAGEVERRAWMRETASAVRATTDAWVAFGTRDFALLPDLCRHGADLASVVEMAVGTDCARCRSYADIDADCPVLVNTFFVPTDGQSAFQVYYDNGYAGALAWSLRPDQTTDANAIDVAGAAAFAAGVSNVGP